MCEVFGVRYVLCVYVFACVHMYSYILVCGVCLYWVGGLCIHTHVCTTCGALHVCIRMYVQLHMYVCMCQCVCAYMCAVWCTVGVGCYCVRVCGVYHR